MIRLDAATFLLQWVTGGMAFCWFTTRRREVGLGYGWMLRLTYATLAAAAAVMGFAFGRVWGRDVASIGVAVACLVVLGVSLHRRHAGVRGQLAEHDRRSARVAAMTGIDRDAAAGYHAVTTDAVERYSGRKPQALADFLEENKAALAQ